MQKCNFKRLLHVKTDISIQISHARIQLPTGIAAVMFFCTRYQNVCMQQHLFHIMAGLIISDVALVNRNTIFLL